MEKPSSLDPKTNSDTLRGWHEGNPAITTARVKFISEYLPRRETLQTPTFQSAALTETSHQGSEPVAKGWQQDMVRTTILGRGPKLQVELWKAYIEGYLYSRMGEAVRKATEKSEATEPDRDIMDGEVPERINDLKMKGQVADEQIRMPIPKRDPLSSRRVTFYTN